MPSEDEFTYLLSSVPWFHDLQPKQVARILAISRLIQTGPGEVIFSEGDQENFVFILLDGQVEVEMTFPSLGRIKLYTAEANDIIGWSSVAPVIRQRTATARSVLAAQLLAIDAAKLRELWDEDHDLGFAFTRRLANVLGTRLLLTRLQLAETLAGDSLL